ncbi:hypothetical protein BX666DRAFT_1877285 [Dichotomocladium elegans]|nr:hypothetical protein BX666DRAFT_1877285 [Dichotomocladium elegans]
MSSKIPVTFDEFRLDPLDGATPPHQLGEARRIFRLCLEPTPGTCLATSLHQFQELSFSQCGPNRAHDSPPHISILGRVQIAKGAQSGWRTVDRLKTVIDQQVRFFDLRAPLFGGYTTVQRPARSVVMLVHVSQEYAKLARSIHRLVHTERGIDLPVVPPMDRLYLAYNIISSLPAADAAKLQALAKETINVRDWVLHGGSWRLSLYEVILESRILGVQQQVELVSSWPVHDNGQRAPLSPWLPASLRVKLAVLSTKWGRNTEGDGRTDE